MTELQDGNSPDAPDLGTIQTSRLDRSQAKHVSGMFGNKINEGLPPEMDFRSKKNILAEVQDAICNKFCESRHKNVWQSHGSIAVKKLHILIFSPCFPGKIKKKPVFSMATRL